MKTASLHDSDAAISSDSHEDNATEGCFLEPQLIAAWLSMNTQPLVECFTAQSESDMP